MLNSLFSKLNLPMTAFLCFALRIVIFGAGIGEAIALFALAGLYGFHYFNESKKEAPVNEKIKADVEYLKNQIASMNTSAQITKAKMRF